MASSKVSSAPKKATEVKESKKKFAPSDLIPCVSITPGELFVVGDKTKILYTWADADDVIEIEYQDLAYAARAKDKMMYKPRYIVQDDDFLKEFPHLEEVYNGLYSVGDLEDILKLTPARMESAINALPEGAKDALQTLIATKIRDGSLDSVKRIQKLDDIFDTKMLMRLVTD